MRRLVLGTAGHIDHGKTALVRAMTGVDTDRLPEEKRRGITIDLGFARLALDDVALDIGIVDVPGHEAFVRNMLAGATGIDLVLLVVAADEGVMPQTREHLAIVELLGIRRGVVAITKTDLVDAEWLDLVRDDVRSLVAGSPLEGAPAVPVSARTGQGIDALRTALCDAAADAAARPDDDLFRMPIDRVFTVRGTGTVVTGTVWSGSLRRDEQVRIEPAGATARVRALHRHGAEAERVGPGERAAIALPGIERTALSRGDTVVTGPGWHAGTTLTVRVGMARDAERPIRARQRVRVHLGTAEVLGRVVLFDALDHGGTALAQLRLEAPILARTGDRVVLRSYSPILTIAGGTVLEPAAPRRRRLSPVLRQALDDVLDPRTAPAAALALHDRDHLPADALAVLTGLTPPQARTAADADPAILLRDDAIFAADAVLRAREDMLAIVRAHHGDHPLDDGIEREALRRKAGAAGNATFDLALQGLLDDAVLEPRGPALALPGFRPAPTPAIAPALERLETTFREAGLRAPAPEELPPDLAGAPMLAALLRYLEREGRLIRIAAGRWTDAAAIARAIADIRTQLPAGLALDPSDFRNVLGLSRKHLIPLLEFFDREGITRRDGDARVLLDTGPQQPDSAARR